MGIQRFRMVSMATIWCAAQRDIQNMCVCNVRVVWASRAKDECLDKRKNMYSIYHHSTAIISQFLRIFSVIFWWFFVLSRCLSRCLRFHSFNGVSIAACYVACLKTRRKFYLRPLTFLLYPFISSDYLSFFDHTHIEFFFFLWTPPMYGFSINSLCQTES